MKILRIYNNNVVVALDDHQDEIILTGKGLAFGKKPGDLVNPKDVDKTFILKDKQVVSKLGDVLKDTPVEYLDLVDDIIRMLREESLQEIGNNLYLSLLDHIRISLEREKKGIVLPNPLLLEIKQYYCAEFDLACKAAKIIEQRLAIRISEDEIGFITLHIVNATLTNKFEDTMLVTKMIQDVICYVERYFNIILNQESMRYARFIRHLQFFARKVVTGADADGDDILYVMGRREYPEAYKCVMQLSAELEHNYRHMPSRAEQGYLIYHIQSLIAENRKA